MSESRWRREHPRQAYSPEARTRRANADRSAMRAYLEEMLEWRDPDQLISRPQTDVDWHRMVDYNLRRWRRGQAEQFSKWRERRDQRGLTDLQLRHESCVALGVTWHKCSDEQKAVVRKYCACVGLPQSEWDANLKDLL